MFKLTHLITVLMATVAIASPQKLAPADCQDPLSVAPDPPKRIPLTDTVLRIYERAGCNTTLFVAEFNLAPSTCYNLPYGGADLLFHTCGQVMIYTSGDCSTGGIILPLHSCYNIASYFSVQLIGC